MEEHTDEKNLLPANIEKEIFETSLDLSLDFAEVGLDTILENDLIKEIPIVKTAVAFYSVGKELHKRHHIRNILTFLGEFHSGVISPEKLDKFKTKFEGNPKFRNKVLELIIVHNERFNKTIKAKIMGNLFRAYINGHYDYERLNHLLEILESITVRALKILEAMGNGGRWDYHYHTRTEEWLENIGFKKSEFSLLQSCGLIIQQGSMMRTTKDGIAIYDFGLSI
ncbi:hypothetical protein GTQ34_09290 [Muricauda sp. JGD-17]|uniref:Uncharacterized protein n=1 Tax=Flagellimonas ochracea TaxID=2696472 RepID=A0A964TC23_9FLAO|nr:hypothetical protein [Allomuricauda ochracea]NAY92113.1 hypothetical protein [Allomuricauda ochracea]